MNLVQVNPDSDEVKLLKKVLLNLDCYLKQGLFMNNPDSRKKKRKIRKNSSQISGRGKKDL